MCWNQVENEKKKKKKVEKESWRKKERGRFWKVESGEKKRERIGIYGYVCVVEKNQEKRKRKRKRKSKRMDDRKKERKNII